MTGSTVKRNGNSRLEREKLRQKGQFWTPEWVAKAMVCYVAGDPGPVFDPAFGRGAFYKALRAMENGHGEGKSFHGNEIDVTLIEESRNMYSDDPSLTLEHRDFLIDPPQRLFRAIVANPPYIRHHRIPEQVKALLKKISCEAIGKSLDGRAGLHIYFLIRALTMLETGGKLAFIMPSDTCEGVFANRLWRWITLNYCLECVITFAPEATPFPNVDTNALVFLIKNTQPNKNIHWVRVSRRNTTDLADYVSSGFRISVPTSFHATTRDLGEALITGLSRSPEYAVDSRYRLVQFASVMRGIATGANDFFFMTQEEAEQRQIAPEFLKLAVGRTRDIAGSYITEETVAGLRAKGRPTLLLSLDGRCVEEFPIPVQKYLETGWQTGLPEKALISTRRPWYKMEQRLPPPFLFAYLGRRNARFIRNTAGALPLTGFLCVYPHSNEGDYIEQLWRILQAPETISNLNLIGKSYGSGALKIEPRSLEKLPIPEQLAAGFYNCL